MVVSSDTFLKTAAFKLAIASATLGIIHLVRNYLLGATHAEETSAWLHPQLSIIN
jgi:hypothetical protein